MELDMKALSGVPEIVHELSKALNKPILYIYWGKKRGFKTLIDALPLMKDFGLKKVESSEMGIIICDNIAQASGLMRQAEDVKKQILVSFILIEPDRAESNWSYISK